MKAVELLVATQAATRAEVIPVATQVVYAADNALYEVKEHRKGEIVMLHKALISQESLDEAKYS